MNDQKTKLTSIHLLQCDFADDDSLFSSHEKVRKELNIKELILCSYLVIIQLFSAVFFDKNSSNPPACYVGPLQSSIWSCHSWRNEVFPKSASVWYIHCSPAFSHLFYDWTAIWLPHNVINLISHLQGWWFGVPGVWKSEKFRVFNLAYLK